MKEAIRSRSGMGPLARVEPSLDWWAEYERFVPLGGGVTEGQSVRVSGHRAGPAEQLEELAGATPTEGEIGGRSARWGIGADGGPAFVTIGLGPSYTVMVLSYELNVNDLRAFAAELSDVDETEWRAEGGQVLDCLPIDPSCPKR